MEVGEMRKIAALVAGGVQHCGGYGRASVVVVVMVVVFSWKRSDFVQVSTFIQTRGSVPVFWTQNVNLKYDPPLRINSSDQETMAFRLHFK